jgi:membrane protein CcdC involved in cytochrome C biogenesis
LVVIYPDINMFNNQSFLIIILILIILQLRQRRIKRPLGLMILPIFMLFITLFIVQNVIFISLLNFGLITASFIIGILIGIVVGNFFDVKVEKDGTMFLKGSFIAVILWILVIALKVYGNNVLTNSGYIDLNVLSSMLLVLTLGAMIARRLFIYNKFRKKIKELDNTVISE